MSEVRLRHFSFCGIASIERTRIWSTKVPENIDSLGSICHDQTVLYWVSTIISNDARSWQFYSSKGGAKSCVISWNVRMTYEQQPHDFSFPSRPIFFVFFSAQSEPLFSSFPPWFNDFCVFSSSPVIRTPFRSPSPFLFPYYPSFSSASSSFPSSSSSSSSSLPSSYSAAPNSRFNHRQNQKGRTSFLSRGRIRRRDRQRLTGDDWEKMNLVNCRWHQKKKKKD